MLTGAAALSLYPRNSSRVLRLEATVELAATGRPTERKSENKSRKKAKGQPKKTKLTPSRFRALLARVSASLPEVVRNEDPFDGPMVEGAVVFGHDVRLLPGLAPEDVFSSRKLSSALEDPDLPEQLQRVRGLLLSVAALSTEIAKRAELPAGCSPELGADGVEIPDGKVLGRLRHAVRFRADELASLCASFGAALSDIEPLVQDFGARPEADFSGEDGPLASRPLIRAGDIYIVGAPHCLLRSVFLHLLRDAGELQPDLAKRFHSACRRWLSAYAPMICGTTPSRFPPISDGDGWLFTGWGVEIDSDKVLYVALLTESGIGPPLPDNLRAVLEAKLSAVEDDREVLLVVLYQRLFLPFGLARVAFEGLAERRLAFCLQDLETAVYGGPVDPLGFWYYAGALDRFEDAVSTPSMSTSLDLWALYCDHKNSFYLGDEQPPNFVWVSPCYASDFRCRVAQDRRRHGIQHPTEPRAVEVVSATATSRSLTFIGVEDDDWRSLRAVEAGVPVWIRTPSDGAVDRSVADAVAFWVGELSEHVGTKLAAEREEHPVLIIDVACTASKDEDSLHEGVNATEAVRVERHSGRVAVEIRSMAPFATMTNVGARHLAAQLYRALMASDGEPAAEQKVSDVLEAVAPLGPKKHLHVSVDTHDLELDPTGLPRPKPVREDVAERLLDDLGAHLRESGKFTVGVPDPGILSAAMEFFFGRLQEEVAATSPRGLLETLVAEHEAIVRDTAWRERTLPSQEAVARDKASFVEFVSDSTPRLAQTAVAGRFLIEYVASTPPTGDRALTRTRLNELVALASMVSNYGMLSNVAGRNLVDLEPSLLPSGRLGMDRARLKEIYEEAHRRRALTGATAVERLPAPNRDEGAETPSWWSGIQPLLRDEFGYSLDEFGDATAALLRLAMAGNRAFVSSPRSEVVASVEDATGWERSDVERVLRAMTLEERTSFEDTGSLELLHVLPWRFNRELSYLRRPLVMREEGDEQWLVWGPRNLSRAWRHLLVLITEGRLRASPEGDLKRCITAIAQEKHERFNDEVADWFDARGFQTRRRAIKFGAERLEDSHGDLGDVDVLVVDHAQRRLLAVECKDVHLALAAADIANQLPKLHRKLKNHRRRAEWLVQHALSVQAELGLADGSWEVLAAAVTDETLVSQSFGDSPVPISALAELERDPDVVWSSALLIGRIELR
ncbi:MAG: hypothetical protein ACRBN8_08730 [Nannocystales bacterium]